ncbi:MAG: nucleotidyltransferase domain-containing protein [Paludibacter sp.]|nr:nucleotidyltransferase domain-containing protein [Paludibacter sp.]
MRRPEIVSRLREIIHKEAPSAKVILYGSEARGDAGKDSDIDLLILVDSDKVTLEDETKIMYPIYELELKTGVLISPMVVSKKEWENRPFKTPFYINVMNEGIEL